MNVNGGTRLKQYSPSIFKAAVMTPMHPHADPTRPLVYACSGCSSAAQMANHLAVRLDREGVAEMSCIAGVGGAVKPLLRLATAAALTGRRIVAIDGCPLACCVAALARAGVAPTRHVQLWRAGVRKLAHVDYDIHEAQTLLAALRAELRGGEAAAA